MKKVINQKKKHVIVRNTRSNGYEFATLELGLFSLDRESKLKKFMDNKGWTYSIINKRSRLVEP